MCQLFNGIYSEVWAVTSQLGVMANVTHQEIAVAIALWGLFGSIGAAIGSAIAGGIWTNILPKQLYSNLPAEYKNQTLDIYSNITAQLEFEMGTPARDAIILSYGHVQRLMVIAGVVIIPICIACLFMWKNVNVRKLEGYERKKKGNVI